MAAIALFCAIGAAFGLLRVKVDDSLSQLFRSDTPAFRQYEDVTQRFPSTEFDVLVVVEGDVLKRDALEKLRDAATDLQLVPGQDLRISQIPMPRPRSGLVVRITKRH